MKLSTLKRHLQGQDTIAFQLPNGELVPRHFHVTEVGQINKQFIDCGGKMRTESTVSLQLWSSYDYNHRLHPEKLLHILELSEEKLGLSDEEVTVEYQGQTVERYSLAFDGQYFQLKALKTDCLAKENCGVPGAIKIMADKLASSACCSPESGCC